MQVLYPELRALAERHLAGERRGHTLQPTALVHEAYLRLNAQQRGAWNEREHFLAVAATMMRRVLVDHARSRTCKKRQGSGVRVTLAEGPAAPEEGGVDILTLDEALERLAFLDPLRARVVEMRFFGGMKLEAIAGELGRSVRSVSDDWAFARAWLRKDLQGQEAGEAP